MVDLILDEFQVCLVSENIHHNSDHLDTGIVRFSLPYNLNIPSSENFLVALKSLCVDFRFKNLCKTDCFYDYQTDKGVKRAYIDSEYSNNIYEIIKLLDTSFVSNNIRDHIDIILYDSTLNFGYNFGIF